MRRDQIELLHLNHGYRTYNLAAELKAAINAFKAKRAARNGRREMLRLGEHLLDDLGFDVAGRPLNPATVETVHAVNKDTCGEGKGWKTIFLKCEAT